MRATTTTLLLAVLAGCAPLASAPVVSEVEADRAVPIAGPDEPGERLHFGGRVLDYDGRPLPGAAVMAYHADARGLYNPPGSPTRVPRLRAVAVTDAGGRFRFDTVRPGAYPDGSEPAHVHLGVLAPAHHVRYVDYWFEGDPLITPARRRAAKADTVIVGPAPGPDGTPAFQHDIRLEGN